MIGVSTDFSSVLKRLDRVQVAAVDLREPLARTGGYIRWDSKKAFDAEGPGWQPLAEATKDRKLSVAGYNLFRKSKSGKSMARTAQTQARIRERALEAAKATRSIARRAKSLLRGANAQATLDAIARASGFTSTDRLLEAIRRERVRSAKHGAVLRATKDIEDPALKRKLRQQAKQRYKVSLESTKMLGGLRSSMFLRLEGNTVVVASRTLWAGVHNDGGSAGHGAKIPERKFLELKPEYREKFREFMAEHFAEAWNGK